MLLKKSSPVVLTALFVATTGLALSFAPACSTVAACPDGVNCNPDAGAGDAGEGGAGGDGGTGGAGTGGAGTGGVVDPCMNAKQDGVETDTDCGGPDCKGCDPDQKCATNTDCVSNLCDVTSLECACPVGMVSILAPGGKYCTDQFEVTWQEYGAFWPNVSPQGSGPVCAWKLSFEPAGAAPIDTTQPVVNVDWCDAYNYCKWNDKRLCGGIKDQEYGFSDYATKDLSEWYNACSFLGTKAFPYGQGYMSAQCNGFDAGNGATLPGTALMSCVGGTPGLYQMSGNVAEWEDSCNCLIDSDFWHIGRFFRIKTKA